MKLKKTQFFNISGRLLFAAAALLSSLTASADTLYATYPSTNTPTANTIVKFTPDGVSSIFATGLNNPYGLAFDGVGNLYVANASSNTIEKYTPADVGSVYANTGLDLPVGLAFDGAGNLYVSNPHSNQFVPGYIEKITPGGVSSLFANVGNDPQALAFDKAGNLYVSNNNDNTIDKITSGGSVSLFANTHGGLAFDSAGNLYVTNFYGNSIEKLSPGGADLGVFANTGSGPVSLAFDSTGNLYVENYYDSTIQKITPGGFVSLFAHTTVNGSYGYLAISPVPEPETYVMLLAGLALISFATLRRKQNLAL